VHDARHTAGTLPLAQGVDIRTVQEALGHSEVRVTEGYTHVASDMARAAMTAWAPPCCSGSRLRVATSVDVGLIRIIDDQSGMAGVHTVRSAAMDIVVDVAVGLIALCALVVAIFANRNASRSADASEDSARQAKRSADAAERQAAAAEAALPPPPPAVAWVADLRSTARGGGVTYVLRNIGTEPASGVQVVVPPSHNGLIRPQLDDGPIPAGGSFQVLVISIDQLPNVHELMVAWDGQNDAVRVPLPAP
jgi:hypothetical protein